MEDKRELSKISDFIEFQFYPEQQLHAFIQIENLTEEIISYKVKTTAPAQYLVKPMEGQIYKKEKAKIVFRRKKLSLQNFQAIQTGIKPSKERFMFMITCTSKNAIGIEKVDEQTKYVNVKFINPRKAPVDPSPIKKTKKFKTADPKRTELINHINIEKSKLQELKKQRESEQATLQALVNIQQAGNSLQSVKGSQQIVSMGLNMQQIVCLIILFLLLGFWL